jgi:site-specific recombinase XerD
MRFHKEEAMGAFRDAMVAEMRLRGFAARTRDTYASWMRRLVLKVKVPADRITEQQVRDFLLELSGRGLSASTMNQAISAVRFFFNSVLRRAWDLDVQYQRAPQRVPVTLTRDEVSRLLAAVPHLRERAAMEISYAAGLRLGEVLNLKLTDIDSGQMILRVDQGREERPQRHAEPGVAGDAAVVLRASKPREWLFPSPGGKGPLNATIIQRRLCRRRCRRGSGRR